ncbi:crossover junction endodeoxyribonuclease RuvC [bacterium]|nr:crossover junction endodeoxyribonuclease RuvC [Chloroflexi bacterium CFX6]RIL12057.1 MAG: crossover junction endodeoxyribonuclease RuvC [bacterium]
MRVLGIDPGTATTGFGCIDGRPGAAGRVELIDHGVIRTAAGTPMPQRLAELHAGLAALIGELRPDAMAVEELFFSSNASTALTVGQARGVILLAGAQAGLPIAEYKPMQVKQALTGYGAADKRQMQDMLRLVLGLDRVPRPDDAADAIAIALCHLQTAREAW